MSNNSWRYKRSSWGDPRHWKMWDHENYSIHTSNPEMENPYLHKISIQFFIFSRKCFYITNSISIFLWTKIGLEIFTHQLPSKENPRRFFSVMSGATGTLQPLPMHISDAERFRDFGERWSFRRVPPWINAGQTWQGKLFFLGNTTYPPPKKTLKTCLKEKKQNMRSEQVLQPICIDMVKGMARSFGWEVGVFFCITLPFLGFQAWSRLSHSNGINGFVRKLLA